VLEFIASKISRNIRELEGALIRVTGVRLAQPADRRPALAEVVLKDLIPADGRPGDHRRHDHGGDGRVLRADDGGPVRVLALRVLVTARQIAMYLCRELTDLSLPKIGPDVRRAATTPPSSTPTARSGRRCRSAARPTTRSPS
jgi:chromosomal replication initiator protein